MRLRSLRARFFGPLLLVAAAGLLGLVGTGWSALDAVGRSQRVERASLVGIEEARLAALSIERARRVTRDLLQMTRLVDKKAAIDEFRGHSLDADRRIVAIRDAALSPAMLAAIDRLVAVKLTWVHAAEILLGAVGASAIPTPELLSRHQRAVETALHDIVAWARHDAFELTDRAAQRMSRTISVVVAMVSLLMTIAAAAAITLVRRTAGEIVGVSDGLRALAEPQTGDRPERPTDEMTEMRAALAGLRESLAEKEALSERARSLAYFDTLTGLANRTAFAEAAAKIIEAMPRPLLVLVDLDGFKEVNDRHGHAAGDELLSAVAGRLGEIACRHGGLAARLGGDEFAVILPQAGDSGSPEAICAELMACLRQPFVTGGIEFRPRGSLGAAFADVSDARSIGDVMRAADLALYQAKSEGRDRHCFYNKAMAEKLRDRRDVADAIPLALASEEFELRFQPQVDLRSGMLCGFEALVRWRHAGQIIMPADFIPIAEESGQIRGIDIWVLQAATAEAVRWLQQGVPPLSMSVNLWAGHLESSEIVEHVRQALASSGLPPALLTLEITETVLLSNWLEVTTRLKQLSALGVQISLDDFGTGYSSLAYLRQLDVDEVKIDRSFLVDLESSSATQVVLDGFVDIARGLDMRVVAEGVETAAQSELVSRLGVDVGQGYLFGAPMTAQEALAFARSHALPDRRRITARFSPRRRADLDSSSKSSELSDARGQS